MVRKVGCTLLLVQLSMYPLGVLAQRARVAVLHVAAQVDAEAAVAPQRLRLVRAALHARQVHAAQLAPPHLRHHMRHALLLHCATDISH